MDILRSPTFWVALLSIGLLFFLFIVLSFLSVYIRAWLADAYVGITNLLAMRLRQVPYGLIVDARITAKKAGTDLSSDELEAHYLAGGNVVPTVQAIIAAQKAGISLSWTQACAIDLATKGSGKSVAEAVRTSAGDTFCSPDLSLLCASVHLAISASVMAAVKKFTEHMRVVRYAENTIQNYIGAIMEFLKFFVGNDWKHLNADDMQRFQKERIIDRNLSYSYQNTMVSAIKQFYEVITGKAVDPDFIKRPRKGRPLPNIFSLEQVSTLIKSIRNEKHRVMLSIGYGCGLRSGEVVKLRPEDIKSDLGMLFVLKSKGNKDRMVPISANLISQLREYFKIYRPKVWLFEGEKEGEHYSQRSLQMVFRKAVERCKFPSKHKFHDLRHSYATHLMDAGTNQHVIQKILGHNDIRTTEIYTHVSKTLLQRVYNPFDNLNL